MGEGYGQVALVTGASRGIGRAVAVELARRGVCIGAVARGRPALARVVADIAAVGGHAVAVPADVTSETQVQGAVETVLGRWGRLDLLIHCAGAYPVRPVTELTLAEWDQVLSANLTSAFLCVRAALPSMLAARRGYIIFIGSVHVTRPVARPDREAYYAAKAGLVGFARGLAASLEEHGVRTAVVHPAWTVSAADHTDPTRQVTAEDVAQAVAYLVSLPPHLHLRELVLTPRV